MPDERRRSRPTGCPSSSTAASIRLIGPTAPSTRTPSSSPVPIEPQYAVGGVEDRRDPIGRRRQALPDSRRVLAPTTTSSWRTSTPSDVIKDSAAGPDGGHRQDVRQGPADDHVGPEPARHRRAPRTSAGTGATVLHFAGHAYIDYMIAQGIHHGRSGQPHLRRRSDACASPTVATSSSRASPPTRCTSTRTRSTGRTVLQPTSASTRQRHRLRQLPRVDHHASRRARGARRLPQGAGADHPAGLGRLPATTRSR